METSLQFENIPLLTTPDSIGGDIPPSTAFVLFDKPKGRSSFWAVKLLRWASGVKKIGHAGTLDPMATGLLVLAMGKSTKFIEQIQADEKEYLAEITFGASTPSYDAETEIEQTAEWQHITKKELENVILNQFTGEIMQKPPVFSALKKDGRRMYEYARKGLEVEIPSRKITIKKIEITRFDLPKVELRIVCGKGTYIRSLAYDIGIALGTLGHLTVLRRTRIGNYTVDSALNEEQIKQIFGKND